MRNTDKLLFDIADAARLVGLFVEGMDRAIFDSDVKTQSAVLYQLTIIGGPLSYCLNIGVHNIPLFRGARLDEIAIILSIAISTWTWRFSGIQLLSMCRH